VTARYEERAAACAARRDTELRRSLLISRLRLAAFLPGAAGLLWRVFGDPPSFVLPVSAVLLVAFCALVVWHARVEERAAWFDALRLTNARGAARVGRDWNALPAAELPLVDLARHPYALDLDVFGRASLAQWLGPAAIPAGAARLSSWLLEPPDVGEIRLRQEAVAELAPLDDWREQLAAHGVLASRSRAPDLERVFEWAEGPGPLPVRRSVWHGAAIVLAVSIWVLLGLQVAGLLSAVLWPIPLLTGLVFSFVAAPRIHSAFDRAGAGQRTLTAYAALFEHAVAAPAGAPRLLELQRRLSAGAHLAPACMRQLNRILGFAELRASAAILHFPIQALTLWDFHVAAALDRWRERVGARVRDWIEAVGELDALSTLARVTYDNPSWCTPVFTDDAIVMATGIGHPLLPESRRIANDVEVGPPGTVLVVTGSNMSGKSTLLRSIGLNVVLAQAGAAACAASFRLPATDLQASVRVQDSLELGLSYFMAAVARLKAIVDAAEAPRERRVLLYLLDEILQGTNSVERSIAVRGVVGHLLEARAIGVMTTHDLSLASEPPLDRAARLVHFTETVDGRGAMSFDYRLRPGLATSRNALRLMEMIGLDVRSRTEEGRTKEDSSWH
jgi:hypothetical protein